MKYIEELHRLKIFHKKDVVAFIGDEHAAKEILRRYKKQGLISQVRRDLYVATDLATKASLAGKFEIAGHITPSSCLAYHAALEYHGLAHQVFYYLYISSNEAFRNFDYDGISYIYCPSKSEAGVVRPVTDSFVRVTDLERTVVDCINRIDLSGGLEELVQCFAVITYINERKLLDYLNCFDKQFLYQKTGFILGYFQKEMKLSDAFFPLCKSKIGKSTRYLTDTPESNTYFKEWKLCAPQNILSFLEQGGSEYV
jgi:predicted transcriptional regulator of viral defense system